MTNNANHNGGAWMGLMGLVVMVRRIWRTKSSTGAELEGRDGLKLEVVVLDEKANKGAGGGGAKNNYLLI